MEHNPIAETIGFKIRERRATTNIPRATLARAVGVGYKSIWLWENGYGCPNIRYLCPLANALDVTVDELLGNAHGS